MYYIGEKQYQLLEGTRQEVWDGKAYKTSGGLLKHNLIINKLGNIVSNILAALIPDSEQKNMHHILNNFVKYEL